MNYRGTNELLHRGLSALILALGKSGAKEFLELFQNEALLEAYEAEIQESEVVETENAESGDDAGPATIEVETNQVVPDLHSEGTLFTDPLTTTQMELFGSAQRDLTPWDVPTKPEFSAEVTRERKELLESLANSQLVNVEQRVACILQDYPETRDSDMALAIRYWSRFDAPLLERMPPGALDSLYEVQNYATILRSRQTIQNDLGLFCGIPRTASTRSLRQMQFHQLLAARRETDPEIRFYLDETGNDPAERMRGVGGICVINWRHYEVHYASVAKWRDDRDWPPTLHFCDIKDDVTESRATSLMAELKKRRGGLLFVGHTVSSRGQTYSDLCALFVHLVIDAVRLLEREGCLPDTRRLTLVKEADDGFDSFTLPALEDAMSREIAREFDGKVYFGGVITKPKGRDVFLECADLIASSMQRRLRFGGKHLKDRLAETVMNVAGFEDAQTHGALFRIHNRSK